MSSTKKVIRNSSMLIVQQLVLNIISIAVTGYIARSLGQADYGKLMFAFSFVPLFLPVVNLGISSIMTREVAQHKDQTGFIVSRILPLRLILSLIAMAGVAVAVNLMGYPADTKLAVYIASLTIFTSALNYTYTSALQGHEKIKAIAGAQMISGLATMTMSVAVLFTGGRLIGQSIVYVIGQAMWLVIVVWYAHRTFFMQLPRIDTVVWRTYIAKGMHFILPAMVTMMGAKMGIIMLSAFCSDRAAGIYGAANGLIERLMVIPDAIATAIFPAMVVAFSVSHEEAQRLFSNFYGYLIMLGLPLAVGTTILAGPLIRLIYGVQYAPSAPVLQILIWWLFFSFMLFIQSTTLNALHREKDVARTTYFSTVTYLVLSFVFIKAWGEKGAAVACVCGVILNYSLLRRMLRQHLGGGIELSRILRIIAASLVMGVAVYAVRHVNLALSTVAGIITYAVMAFALKLIGVNDIHKIKNVFNRAKPVPLQEQGV